MSTGEFKRELLQQIRALRERATKYENISEGRAPGISSRYESRLPKLPLEQMSPLKNSLRSEPRYTEECDPKIDAHDNVENFANCRPVPPLNVNLFLKGECLMEKEDLIQTISEVIDHLSDLRKKIYEIFPNCKKDDLENVRDIIQKWFDFYDEGVAPEFDSALVEKSRFSLMRMEKQYLEMKLVEIIKKNHQFELTINHDKKEYNLSRSAHHFAVQAADFLFDAYKSVLDKDARLEQSTKNITRPVGNILFERGYKTLRDIVMLKYFELLDISGIGPHRASLVIQFFEDLGLPKPIFAFPKMGTVDDDRYIFYNDFQYGKCANVFQSDSKTYSWTLPKLYRPYYELDLPLDGRPRLQVLTWAQKKIRESNEHDTEGSSYPGSFIDDSERLKARLRARLTEMKLRNSS